MNHEEAKGICRGAFEIAERQVGSDRSAIEREVSLMASRDRNLMRALHLVEKHESAAEKNLRN